MTFQELLDDERALGHAQGLEEGIGIGREEGIVAMITMAKKHHVPEDEIIEQLMTDFELDEKKQECI